MTFEKVKAVYDDKGRRSLVPTGEPDQFFECDDVLVAVGQENAFPWIEKDSGIEFDKWGLPVLDKVTFQASRAERLLRRRLGVRPEEHHLGGGARPRCRGLDRQAAEQGRSRRTSRRPASRLMSQKMGIHEWSYDNEIANDLRFKVPWADIKTTLKNVKMEVELGFDVATAWKEAQRCLNCDVQTVFTDKLCIECDACVDICPMDCITFTGNGEEKICRTRLNAPAKNLDAGSVRFRPAENAARHGEGRGRLPALRPVRRALPDRRLGHAEVADRDDLRRQRLHVPNKNIPRKAA